MASPLPLRKRRSQHNKRVINLSFAEGGGLGASVDMDELVALVQAEGRMRLWLELKNLPYSGSYV